MALELAFKAWAVWLAILLLAIANGVLREAMLVPALGKPVGQVLSGVLVPVLVVWGRTPLCHGSDGCRQRIAGPLALTDCA